MLLGGLQKTTLIDFPGRVACTVFTLGCNFRCPFCHNKDLVSLKNFQKKGLKLLKEKSFFEFLAKRKKILDGVCISGGEPTLQKDLLKFCKEIKNLGLDVKIDTNGSNPKILRQLIDNKLVNFIAMDIKTTFNKYREVSKYPVSSIKESIRIILVSSLEHEFRTTVVPGIHNKKIMFKLAQQLEKEVSKVSKVVKATKVNWVLQQFRPQNCLNREFLKLKPFSNQELESMLNSVKKFIPNTKLRGIE